MELLSLQSGAFAGFDVATTVWPKIDLSFSLSSFTAHVVLLHCLEMQNHLFFTENSFGRRLLGGGGGGKFGS